MRGRERAGGAVLGVVSDELVDETEAEAETSGFDEAGRAGSGGERDGAMEELEEALDVEVFEWREALERNMGVELYK